MASEERRQPEAGGESDGGGGQQRAEARRQAAVAEVPGGAGAGAGAALLGETGLALGCCIAAALSWERPLRSLGGFVCANLLFWFVALTPWRVYHLTSLIILGVLVLQIIKDLVLSRIKGAQLWRRITDNPVGLNHYKNNMSYKRLRKGMDAEDWMGLRKEEKN